MIRTWIIEVVLPAALGFRVDGLGLTNQWGSGLCGYETM